MPMTPQSHVELASRWAEFPAYVQRALRDFARYPYVSGNLNYVVAYLMGLRDAKVMSSQAYAYALALPAEIQTDPDLRNEVRAHAQQTVPLASTIATA